ncbi:MAG: 16S rRNA (cytidine(1402)-2'-O)-methyltransferase [Clostridia bacterium]|nr:16S rRNA (cytidine(1402)-2'-O)-methyltransferase [Clostridia bacterium]
MNTNDFEFREEKNKIEKGILYLVATPIGNMSDISERALKVLEGVDRVAAEDTRNSGKLLSYYGIKQNYISYHEHNKAEVGEKIVDMLKNGESIALITDAGMPAISDPGEDLVRLCAENNVKITCVTGACALTTALVLSGLNTRRFSFEGFLSAQNTERRTMLEKLKDDERTLIFYEAPHKLRTTLDDMFVAFGDRKIALCRELTKLNEEVCRTTIGQAIELYKTKEPRGEYVLVVEGADNKKEADWTNLTVDEHIDFYVTSFGLSKMDAIKKVAKDRGVPKGDIYKLTINKK